MKTEVDTIYIEEGFEKNKSAQKREQGNGYVTSYPVQVSKW